jgi:MFS family permease
LNDKKIYYGWWIVVSGFFISLYTTGVINFGFTAVIDPIVEEFGWSYTQISLASSLRGLETGLLAPLIGFLVDKLGPRKPLVLGIIILGLGCFFLSKVSSLGMFYFAYVLIAIGVSTCGGTLFNTAIVAWFQKRTTMASGILTSGVAIGGLMVPVVTIAIDRLGWQMAMVSLGLGMWIICLPLAFLIKNKPRESNNLLNSSQNITSKNTFSINQTLNQNDIAPIQAIRSRTFWHICLSLFIQGMVLSAVLTHVMPYLNTLGFTRTTSSLIASGIPLFSILGRLGFGWLGDKNIKLRLTALGFAFTSLGLFFFGFIAHAGVWVLAPFFICIGLGYGSYPMRVSLVKEYFGRARFGTIHGFVQGIMMIGNVLGPPLAGLVYDRSGSYQNIWYIFAATVILSSFIILATPPVKRKTVIQSVNISSEDNK